MTKITADVVQGFVGSVLASRFDGQAASPPFHKECWELCCSDHRYVAIAAPRGHAKSTAITLGYGLATLLFRERKFLVIVSDTEAQAAGFLTMMKQELTENNELIDLFGIKRNDKGEVDLSIKDSETALVVQFAEKINGIDKFRIVAKGAEQKLRGLLWDGSRPDIIICDDIENDELVMNQERRKKLKNWFNGALVPSLADRGIIRMVGTILHSDSLLEGFMPNPSDKLTHSTPLKQWTTRRKVWQAIKYRAHNRDFTQLLWPQKKTAFQFQELYEQAKNDGTTDSYSREYLNYPIDESISFFKRADFLPRTEEDKKLKLNHYVAVDLAISEEETADYSVFVVAGVDENKMLHVVDVVRERLDGRDIVDTLISLQRTYDPVAMGVEDMQVTKSIGPFLNETMVKTGTFITLHRLKHGGKDKVTRARSIQARTRAHGVKFDKDADWFYPFEQELLSFPRGKNDDQVDAFAYLGLMLEWLVEAPTQAEEDQEEYQLELEQSGMNKQGRSKVTGY
jgi:predicted phage terminase large subunit-like protein